MAVKNDDPKPQKPPTTSTVREVRLAKALRDNLRRRKAVATEPPSGDGGQ